MIHEKVDIERWKAMFSLEKLRAQERARVLKRYEENPERFQPSEFSNAKRRANNEPEVTVNDLIERQIKGPGGEIVIGPFDIAVVEQVRDEALRNVELPESVPTDAFVFNIGEPVNREVTKVGGLPYFPSVQEWPSEEDGCPLTFVAQFCFADSRDICGQLPGDILLIFANEETLWDSAQDSPAVKFFWMNLGLTNLITPDQLPITEWKIAPYYGAIHRTVDYPNAEEAFKQYKRYWSISRIEGTKIGSASRWIQEDPRLPGRFLCALGSIQASHSEPYPYLNHPDPIDQMNEKGNLIWGDMGCLYLTIDDDQQVHWAIQGY